MLNNLIVRGLQRAQPGGPATRYVVCDPDDRCVKEVVERHQRENKDVEVVVAKSEFLPSHPFLELWADSLEDPHDLTLQSSTIISMIPKLTHVQSVYTSSSSPSVLSALKSGELSPEEIKKTICMDESTVEMEGSRAVAQAVEETGAAMVDAPVSGGTFYFSPRLTSR
jgi:3-hydroxyisobutyrate dehydrogenase-like beta-hydroxyacid dehydrogenase